MSDDDFYKDTYHRAFAAELEAEPRKFTDIFPRDAVQRLIDQYRIEEPAQIRKFWEFLQFSASYYLFMRQQQRNNVRPGIVGSGQPKFDLLKPSVAKSRIEEICDLAQKLQTGIFELDPILTELFWRPQRGIYLLAQLTDIEKSDLGHTIIRRRFDNGAIRYEYLNQVQIMEALEIVKNLAVEAFSQIPRDKGGQIEDEALRMYVVNAHAFWVRVLGRRFTYGFSGQLPKSLAARFCCDILRPLDPNVHPRTIGTAMRKEIKRAGTGKYRRSKNPR